jgi:ABC-type transport system substrate-binding protein
MLHRQMAASALAATMLAVAGCGGSSKTAATTAAATSTGSATTGSATTPSTATGPAKTTAEAEFIARGDAICAHLKAQINASPVSKATDFARVLPQVAAYEQAEQAELSKLTPTAALVNDWKHILSDTRKMAEGTVKLAEYVKSHNNSTVPSSLLRPVRIAHENLAHIAKHDGFTQCSAA